jgi:glyoxylase-like metal-dependent hydrolase (beta-lactamase superfamily II)
MSAFKPIYEIYALKYAGPFVRPLAKVIWNTGWDETIEIVYYIWVIKGDGRVVIVDCGMAPKLAGQFGLQGYVNPAEVLARIGIEASRVRQVIVTHINFDHVSGLELFPDATVYVQEREFKFYIKDPLAKKPPFLMSSDPASNACLAALEGTKRLVLVDGDREILPGIELLLAPGHTPGLQAVAINTARGTAVLGSDCGHIFKNYEDEIPSCFIVDLVSWMKSYDKLKAKVSSPDLLFPGHDIRMLTDYPKIAEDVTRLV